MVEDVSDSWFDEVDRKFLNLSSKMADIFSETYGKLGYRLIAPLDPNKFDNATSKAKEVGIRALIVLGGVLSFWFAGTYLFLAAVILGAGSKVFRGIGFYFQKNGFTHIRGSAEETTLVNSKATVMTWNIRGYGGGLHYDHGGVIHWRSRLDRIVDHIQREDPDVLVLQEVYDTSLIEALIDRLGSRYANFYTHLGPSTWGKESGCMVITKCAVHNFTETPFNNNDAEFNRGFATLEIQASPQDNTPCARIIGTQLTPDKAAKQKRVEQIAQIVDQLAQEKLALPTLFVGSLHLDRNSEEDRDILARYLNHSYLQIGPTHSDELVNQWAPIAGTEQSSDFISFFKRNLPDNRVLPVIERNIRLLESRLVHAFNENYDTKTALSDHHAVVTTFSGLRPGILVE